MLFSNGPSKAFLVPDSCRATERNGNSINADVTDEKHLSQLFSDNLTVVIDSLILQDKHTIHTLLLSIELNCTRCEAD